MLLESNILIYAAQPEHAGLRALVAEHAPSVSVISYIEVFGYHELGREERARLEEFFHAAEEVFPLSDAVVRNAVDLRQQWKTGLGDSILAATALVHGCTLVTHNTKDFHRIAGLALFDPLTSEKT